MAISGQANINIGAENQVAGSDNLYDAFHTIQNNFTTLFQTASPFNTFRAGDGVTVAANTSNGVVNVTNTGVLKVTAGSGISISGTTGNVTISTIPQGPAGVTKVGLTSQSLTVTGGNIVSEGTFTVDLPRIPTSTNFATGTYVAPNVTVDGFGRITAISNGIGVGTVTSVGLAPGKGISVTGGPIVDEGTITVENSGVTSLQAGTGILLSGSNGDITITATGAGAGSVKYVGVTSNNLTITGGPITETGNITIDIPSSFTDSLYSNTNAAAYLETYTGNLTPNKVTASGNVTSGGNISATGNIAATGNITANNITAVNTIHASIITANTISGSISGNATSAGTVTTNAQPNITSTGTLTSVAVSGAATVGGNLNLTGNAIITGNTNTYTMTSTYASVGSGLSIGKDGYILFNAQNNSGNYVAFIPPLSIPSAGLVWMLPNTLGTATQVLGTDGSGLLQWKTPPAAGTNTQVLFNDVNVSNGSANLTFNKTTNTLATYAVTATSATVTANVTGGNLVTGGVLSVTGNANVGNLGTSGTITASRLISNVATGTAPFTVTSTTQVANLNVATAGTAGTVTTASQPNITAVGTLQNLTVSGIIAGNSITTSGYISASSSITGSAVTSNSWIYGSGNVESGSYIVGQYVKASSDLYVYGKSHMGPASNVQITGGTSGQFLSTDGAGNLTWATASGGGGSFDGANVVAISNTASSTSKTTGALTVSGGVGISGNVNTGGPLYAEGTITSALNTTGPTGSVSYSRFNGSFTVTEGEWLLSGLYYDGSNIIINEKYWKDPVGFAQVKNAISSGVQFAVDPGGWGGFIITPSSNWVEQTIYGSGVWTIAVGSKSPSNLPTGALAIISIDNVTLVTGGTTSAKLVTGQVIKTALNGQVITNRITSHDADVTFSTYDIMFNAYRKVYIGGFGQAAITLDDKVSLSSTGVLSRSDGDLTFYPGIQGGGEGIIMTRSMVSAKFVGTWATTYSSLGIPNTPVAGQRAFITDSDKPAAGNFGSLAGGGGINTVPVYFDGTNWRIG